MSWAALAAIVNPLEGDTDTSNIKGSHGEFEYYTIVIGFTGSSRPNFTDIINYQPRGLSLDDQGNPIPATWGRTNKAPQWKDQELKQNGEGSIEDTPVIKWSCPSTIRSSLPKEHRDANDAIKTWLSKNEGALWWHNGNSDLCSKHGGPHLHIIAKSTRVGDGLYRRLNTGSSYQPIVKSVKAAGGYIRSQGVKSLESLILYLNTPPRIFMGSICTTIGAIRSQYNERDIRWTSEVNDIFDELFDDCDSTNAQPGGNEPRRLKRNAFECTPEVLEMVARLQNRKSGAGFNTGRDSGESVGNVQPGPSKRHKLDFEQTECPGMDRVEIPKSTPKSKYVATLEKIMIKYNAHDKESIIELMINDRKPKVSEKVKLFIQHLTRMGQLEQFTSAALDSLKLIYLPLTFSEIAKRARYSDWFNGPDYFCIQDSLRYWLAWIEEQGWSPSEIVKRVRIVYDKKKPKINSFVIIGKSNTGKSMFMWETLQKLHPMIGTYTCAANEDRFAFDNFPGKRVAFSHEGTFGTSQMEMAKTIAGGQPCMVEVKHKNKVRAGRIPWFISCQHEPWLLALNDDDKEAFRNRCFFYETRKSDSVPELEKLINPNIWYYLLLADDAGYTDEEYCSDQILLLDEEPIPEQEVNELDDSDDYELE